MQLLCPTNATIKDEMKKLYDIVQNVQVPMTDEMRQALRNGYKPSREELELMMLIKGGLDRCTLFMKEIAALDGEFIQKTPDEIQ